MKHVSILLLHHVNLAGMENARQGFLEANVFLEQQGQSPMFDVEIVGQDRKVSIDRGLYTIEADRLLNEVQKTDMILIPPVQKDLTSEALKKNQGFFPWIKDKRDKGAQVASLCLGAFILGCTGLLNGKSCVTHWRAAPDFKKLFPEINMVPDKILTDEDGIYTGGGAFSSANLILYLIEKQVGKEAAIYCSKIFQIDRGRNSQSPFIIFTGQKDH
ncbi:GlxA family transcriptional regulator [Cyclobacterium plantarum]|uniref:GlxA family transcriptional regulator n=1 Tax=Cyclobacterium plantarum TaxID=2716263 RepID=UPI00293C00BD|nr:DJ-1/PfpI family protein [Cyclobacterium plantarum]